MSKEILMARRPMDHVDAASFSRSGGNSVGASYQPPPISNYKGVMLCDRPVVKTGKPTHLESGQAMPFSCSIGPLSKFERIGLNPSQEEKAARLAMESKVSGKTQDDYFTKHRQWLAQLKRDKKKKEAEEALAQKAEEEKRERFKEYSAKLRQSIAEATREMGGSLTEEALQKHQQATAEAAKAERQSQASTPDQHETKKKKSKKSKKAERPVWSMTEKQLEEKEEEDVDDLINFASNLDYDKYIEDWEVRSAIAAVKDRVAELMKATGNSRRRNGGGDAENDESLVLPDGEDWKQEFVNEWNREDVERLIKDAKEKARAAGAVYADSVRSDGSMSSRASRASKASRASRMLEPLPEGQGGEVEESTQKLAERVLQAARELKRIHSSHSVKAILEKGDRKHQKLPPLAEDDIGPLLPPPTVVQYQSGDIGGPKGAAKLPFNPSNLPYLHRNPAI